MRLLFTLVFAFLTFTSSLSLLSAQTIEQDKDALIALFLSTNPNIDNVDNFDPADISWTRYDNWLDDSVPLNDWYGIEVRDGRVYKIDLNSNNLLGSIPAEIGNLDALNTLNLRKNKLSGEVPTEVSEMTALVSLFLWDNQLSGPLPEDLSYLPNLRNVNLRNNDLTSLSGLNGSALFYLDVQGNDLEEIGTFDNSPKLKHLKIQRNKLTFADILGIHSNNLIAFAYAPQDSVGEYQNITLTKGDDLTLSIPVSANGVIYTWFKDGNVFVVNNENTLTIEDIQLHEGGRFNCQLSHPDLSDLTLYSRNMDVSINTGRTNDSLALMALYNNLNGDEWLYKHYSSGVCVLRHVIGWTDGTPLDDWDFVTLNSSGRVIKFENRGGINFSGILPAEIGLLTEVTYFILMNAELSGELPSEIGHLTNLRLLGLSSGLSGELPPTMNKLTQLINFNVSDNNFEGPLPDVLGVQENLGVLWINHNRFTSIPLLQTTAQLDANIDHNRLSFKDLEPTWEIATWRRDWNDFIPQYNTLLETTEYHVNSGDPLTIDLDVGSDYTLYRWRKNGTYLSDYTKEHILTISSITPDDAGTYVLATKSTLFGNHWGDEIIYTEPIQIVVDGISQVSAENSIQDIPKSKEEYIRLATVSDYEPITYAEIDLYRNKDIHLTDEQKLKYMPKGLNYIENIESIISGKKALRIEHNSAMQTNSAPIQEKAVSAKTSVFLVCELYDAAYDYQWFNNGHVIDGETNPTLSISNMDLSKAGLYHCRLTNNMVQLPPLETERIELKLIVNEKLDIKEGLPLNDNLKLLPETFDLQQNYPNPFNPSTTIRYDLPSDSNVKLQIFNSAGQLVTTLVNGYEAAGYRTALWNGRNRYGNAVASGVYFYRIEAGSFVQSRKMLLLK
jgi:Leucine-rich repeat (LRR) protein